MTDVTSFLGRVDTVNGFIVLLGQRQRRFNRDKYEFVADLGFCDIRRRHPAVGS
jgi:hypothetical protein